MRTLKTISLMGAFHLAGLSSVQADINVLTSIKPVHSLVSAVMEGVATPTLIIDGAGSPHTYALKPSQAKKLQNADLVFWMGDELEAFLEKPIKTIAKDVTSIKLSESHGLNRLKFREGGAFDEHEEHAKDEHDEHEEHAKDEHDEHEEHAKDEHDEHGHDGFDPHVWLDPINAKALVHEIEKALIKADPSNSDKFEANADKLMGRLDELTNEVTKTLEPVHDKGFIVFHDAYQYFERRFGLVATGSITVSPEVMPGAERIRTLQDKVRDLTATCVFSEPQFEPKLVETLVKNTGARTGVLDPLGTSIQSGPELYFSLIQDMARSFKSCLSGKI